MTLSESVEQNFRKYIMETINSTQYHLFRNRIAEKIKKEGFFYPPIKMFGKAPGTRYSTIFRLYFIKELGSFLNDVVDCFLYQLKQNEIKISDIQIAGQLWTSAPIIGAIATKLPNTNTFFIRRERKHYGPQNIFEGTPDPNLKTILINDLANSTNAFYLGTAILIKHNIPVHDKCFAILNKNEKENPWHLWDKYSKQEIMSIVTRDMVK